MDHAAKHMTSHFVVLDKGRPIEGRMQFDASTRNYTSNAARSRRQGCGGWPSAERVLQVMPSMPLIARAARLFLINAVHQLAGGHGIRQFLDIGTGLPAADNTHDVAQRVDPESRIVYVDHDPVVLSHAQALLTSSPEGKTDYLQADLRDTGTIVAGADPRSRPAGRRLADRGPALHPGPGRPVPDRGAADGGRAVGQLPGDGPRGQRHRARGVRGDGAAL